MLIYIGSVGGLSSFLYGKEKKGIFNERLMTNLTYIVQHLLLTLGVLTDFYVVLLNAVLANLLLGKLYGSFEP